MQTGDQDTFWKSPECADRIKMEEEKGFEDLSDVWYKQRIWHKRTMKNKCHRGSKGIQLMTWAQIQILHIIPMQNISTLLNAN